MPRLLVASLLAIASLFALASIAPSVHGCTGLTIHPTDGSVIFARTLEFARDLHSAVLVIPRGQSFTGTTPSGKPGHQWTSQFASVGMNGFGLPAYVDGLNEKGLGVGAFFFPGFAKYQVAAPADADHTIACYELPLYLLTTCADVDAAVDAARSILVAGVVAPELGIAPPAHFILNDASGRSVVLEHIDGELRVYENPLGVITNSPSFDWHLTNLRNYVKLSDESAPPVDFGSFTINSLGQGSGMLGLPGDFTPPSRFVRAVAFSQSALPVATARAGVLEAFHLLNQFDIPRGASRGVECGHPVTEWTLWTSAQDLTNRRYYFHTYENRQVRVINLGDIDLDGPEQITVSISGDERIDNLTPTAQ